ncbi:MAG: transporter [Gemmatimonadetes bacterium]|nr:transporter [Gemmatimonadota bacterium]
MLRRPLGLVLPWLLLATPLHAQTLRQKVMDLFTFGTCGEPLCLDVNAAVHGNHYNPLIREGQANILAFLTSAIGAGVSNFPVAATSGGTTFTFEGGVPVATSTSAGPIFAERAPTLGRGRLLLGAGLTGLSYKTIRGVPLSDLLLNFTHQDVGAPGLGDVSIEDDVFQVETDLNVDLLATTVVATYGLLDRVDIGIAVPFVHASIRGRSTGRILAESGTDAHRLGTPDNPKLEQTVASEGSASGIGDLAARIKINLGQTPHFGAALLGQVRFPTGNEEDFLGAGSTRVSGLLVGSGRYGPLSPHVNLGYASVSNEFENDVALATLGFDHLMLPWLTLAVDVISRWPLGASKLALPPAVTITSPLPHVVEPGNIPDRRDNTIDGAFGFKIAAGNRINVIANTLVPLNHGGMRPTVGWTFGLEYNFYPAGVSATEKASPGARP